VTPVTLVDFFLIFASVSVVVVAAMLIPAILQLRRTYRRAEEFFDAAQREIGPLSKKLGEAATEIEILAASCTARVEAADAVINTARQAADTMLLACDTVRNSVRPLITNIGGLAAGVRTFSHFFLRSR